MLTYANLHFQTIPKIQHQPTEWTLTGCQMGSIRTPGAVGIWGGRVLTRAQRLCDLSHVSRGGNAVFCPSVNELHTQTDTR